MHDLKALRRVRDYASAKELLHDKSGQWPAEIERRGAPRFDYHAEGCGTLLARGSGLPPAVEPDFPVIALTLSRGGTGFLCNYDLQPGDLVELSVPAADGQMRTLMARVVRSRRAGLNAYEIGAEFTED